MRIIEKKCPNCGAGLSFNETDKTCKCEYCHREFEIERDKDIYSLIDPDTAKTVAKTGLAIFAASSILPIIVFIIAIIGFVCLGFFFEKTDRESNKTTIEEKEKKEEVKKPVSNINQLSNNDLALFARISHNFFDVKGESSTKYNYLKEDDEVYKYILAYKDDSNYLYIVQRVLYINFFNKNDKKTVFIPAKCENVVTGLRIVDDEYDEISNGAVVDAPRFYLNSEKTTYLRGAYANYNKFYSDKIEPLKKKGYTITERK